MPTQGPEKSTEEKDELVEFYMKSKPLPFMIPVITSVMKKTVKKRQAQTGRQFCAVINGLDQKVCDDLAKKLAELNTQVIANWSLTQPQFKLAKAFGETEEKTPLSRVYHRGPHGAEMSQD